HFVSSVISYLWRPSLFTPRSGCHRALHSFPTRRSSDLWADALAGPSVRRLAGPSVRRRGTSALHRLAATQSAAAALLSAFSPQPDRKSTRLNSSHVSISYAVFCLKKKKNQTHD